MNKEEIFDRARELRRNDELEESQELLISLLEDYPDDPLVLFEVGGSYDVLGQESDAIPYYERAIEEELDGPELLECFVCLGSAHRAIGEFQEAVNVLEDARERFPNDNNIKSFLALAYYSNERYDLAVQLLLEIILETTNDPQIQAYADTLDFYKDNLDEVWDD